MNYRKLRIAWSVGCGILCLLLIALWVRSYWWYDTLNGRGLRANHFVAIASEYGLVGVLYRPGIYRIDGTTHWRFECQRALPYPTWWSGEYRFDGQAIIVMLPAWLLMSMIIAIAATVWIPWSNRFSLRTLLIGMTVIAVTLGHIIALSR